MSTRIDHAKEAQEWIMRALNPSDAFERSSAAKVAEVHATLALVEQQRTANLLKVMELALTGTVARVYPDDTYVAMHQKINPQIEEALGL